MKQKNTQRTIYLLMCVQLIVGGQTNVLAQKNNAYPVHVGIIYPLSTNGRTAPSDTNDFSLHLIAGVSQQENKVHIAGVSGVVWGNAHGVMVSGVSNHIGQDANGVQIAGMLNRVGHHAGGVQVAGLANIIGGTGGTQVAGLLNKSGDATTQIAGLVNVAKKVRGIQLSGLINIAEESDYPIGLLNIIKNGEMGLGATIDEGGTTMAALRSGGNVLYSVIGVGYNFKDDEARYVLEGGIGAHLVKWKALRFNTELVSAAMTNFEDGVYGRQSLRALLGYRITPRIELFAGPTFNHLLFKADQRDIRNDRYLWKWSSSELVNGFFAGGIAGLQIVL